MGRTEKQKYPKKVKASIIGTGTVIEVGHLSDKDRDAAKAKAENLASKQTADGVVPALKFEYE